MAGTGLRYPVGGAVFGADTAPSLGGRPEAGTTGAGGMTGRGCGELIGRAGGGPDGDPAGCAADRRVGPEIDGSIPTVGDPDIREPGAAEPGGSTRVVGGEAEPAGAGPEGVGDSAGAGPDPSGAAICRFFRDGTKS